MYRVVTEQRGATAIAVPRLPADQGWAMDVAAVRAAAAGAQVVWLCSPNNPTALAEPPGAIADLLDGIAADANAAGREPAVIVLDEAYAEFVDASLLPLRLEHPNLIVVRTASKAYALAGLRVGFALARPETIARIAPYRPPGSIATTSVTIVTAALEDRTAMRENVAASSVSAAGSLKVSRARAGASDRRSRTSSSSASRARRPPPRPPRRSCGTASCRGRSGRAIHSPTRSG
jgi:histidinol-phosphate aminotransferase